jgi:hypothetical protein
MRLHGILERHREGRAMRYAIRDPLVVRLLDCLQVKSFNASVVTPGGETI